MSFFLKCEDGVYLSQHPLVFTVGEIGGSENPVGFDHFVYRATDVSPAMNPTAAGANPLPAASRLATVTIFVRAVGQAMARAIPKAC